MKQALIYTLGFPYQPGHLKLRSHMLTPRRQATRTATVSQPTDPMHVVQVAICYTYRAHWELQHLRSQRDRDRYGPAILAAREGLALVAEAGPGGSLRALHPQGASLVELSGAEWS